MEELILLCEECECNPCWGEYKYCKSCYYKIKAKIHGQSTVDGSSIREQKDRSIIDLCDTTNEDDYSEESFGQ